jgi:hypothetical protein
MQCCTLFPLMQNSVCTTICMLLLVHVIEQYSGIFRLTLSSTGVSFSTNLKAVYLDFPLYLRKLVMLNIFWISFDRTYFVGTVKILLNCKVHFWCTSSSFSWPPPSQTR